MSDGEFPAIDGNALGELCSVMVDRATVSYLLGSVKWLAAEERYSGDIEDIYETTQAFELFARRLMQVTDESECVELVTIPPSTIVSYMGTTAPEGWLLCDGAQYDQVDYPALAAVLPDELKSGFVFYVPDMRGRMTVGVNTPEALFPLAETGGEDSHELSIDELPSHTHIQDAHTHLQTAHNHLQDPHTHLQTAHNHLQDPHTHLQTAHNHLQDPHTHLQNAHQHGFNQRGSSAAGIALAMGSNGTGSLYSVNTDNATAVNQNATPTNQAATAVNQNATPTNQAATAVNQNATPTNQAATAVNQSTTAINQPTGGNVAHNNMPPYFAVNWIIKT